MDERRSTIGGRPLPTPGRAVLGTVLLSVLSYFVFGRGAASLVAVIGGGFVTVVMILRDQT
jgi:hypothetical protein